MSPGVAATAAELAAVLQAYLTRRLPNAAKVTLGSLRRSGGGTSRENWSFDASWTTDGKPVTRPLLLRRDPIAGVVETDRQVEYRLLQALEGAPLPTPVVRWFEADGAELGRPFMIMDRAQGASDRAVLTDRNPFGLDVADRVTLGRRYCELLAEVHRLDIEHLGIDRVLPPPHGSPAEREIDRWEAELSRQALEPQPALRLVAWWLREHIPPQPTRLALVHGDYRPANALIHDGRVEALLDWEFAHLGDPLEDVGWYCAPLYRREHFIPGRWEQPDFLRRYTDLTGIEVSTAALSFWQTLAMFKLAVLALTAVRIFCAGDSRRPAAPAGTLVREVLRAAGAWPS